MISNDDFIAGAIVTLDEDFGIVLNSPNDYPALGLIRWDTKKENDTEDWLGLFGTFVEMGGRIINQDYQFKFINKDGSLKTTNKDE